MEQIKPTYSQIMRFPVEVKIPAEIAIAIQLPRTVLIRSADNKLPVALVEWLKADPRYADWFAEPESTPEAQIDESPKKRRKGKESATEPPGELVEGEGE